MYDLSAHKDIAAPNRLICDLDGTLTKTSARGARISSVTDKLHVPFSTAAFQVMQKGYRLLKATGIQPEIVERLKNEVYGHLCAEEKDTYTVLSAAFHKYIPCTLISNGPKEWGNRALYRHVTRPFFEDTYFREDCHDLKPDPTTLLQVLEKNADFLPKKATIWVWGDRPSDVKLAFNTHVRCDHDVLPVAIAGTQAAAAIETLQDTYGHKGHIFNNAHDLACAIDPDLEDRIETAINCLSTPISEHVATLDLK